MKNLYDDILTEDQKTELNKAIEADVSVMIIGGESSGKTEMLKWLMDNTPQRDKMVLMSPTVELKEAYTQRNLVHLLNQSDNTIGEHLRQTMSLGFERLIYDEVYGTDDIVRVTKYARSGISVFATMHANDYGDAIQRLAVILSTIHAIGWYQAMENISHIFGFVIDVNKDRLTGEHKVNIHSNQPVR